MIDKEYSYYTINEFVVIETCLPKEIGIINNIKDDEITVNILDSEIFQTFNTKHLRKIKISNNHFFTFCEEIENERFKVKNSVKEVFFCKRREKDNDICYDDYIYNDNKELNFYYLTNLVTFLDKTAINYDKTKLLQASLV